jgi:hypothetical protein
MPTIPSAPYVYRYLRVGNLSAKHDPQSDPHDPQPCPKMPCTLKGVYVKECLTAYARASNLHPSTTQLRYTP